MRRLFPVLFLLAGCDAPAPSDEVREAAHAAAAEKLRPVARFDDGAGNATAYRLDYASVELGLSEWRWRETEVFAQRSEVGPAALTNRTAYRLDPRQLAHEVPATYSNDAWGLRLSCADRAPCIEAERRTVRVAGAERQEETQSVRTNSHEWLFDRYQDRDDAIVAVRRAIGAQAR